MSQSNHKQKKKGVWSQFLDLSTWITGVNAQPRDYTKSKSKSELAKDATHWTRRQGWNYYAIFRAFGFVILFFLVILTVILLKWLY